MSLETENADTSHDIATANTAGAQDEDRGSDAAKPTAAASAVETAEAEHTTVDSADPDVDDLKSAQSQNRNSPEAVNAQVERDNQATVFGSFWIDTTEFALPVSFIQEMVAEPSKYAPVPLSPPHLLGVFNLRDSIVPVIDLRVLLGFPEFEAESSRKIAIIENGAHCLGLLFDESGGVINSDGAVRVDFEANDEGQKDVVVEGMLKLDDGKRLIQIIDPYTLLNIKQLPRVTTGAAAVDHEIGDRRNCITFQLGHTQCALDVSAVQEILEVPEVHHSPLAHGHILGNIELRGRTLPIVDFRGLMGNEEPFKFSAEALKSRKMLILNLADGPIGLVVYSIDSIMAFFDSDVLPFSNVTLPRDDLVSGCLMGPDETIFILLNHESLLTDEALCTAAKSCQSIFPPKKDSEKNKSTKVSHVDHNVTYILFTCETQFAVDISCVNEILERPAKLLQPPYALDYVDGILNLRGDLITLIKPRVLYDLPDKDSLGDRVLIFHKGDKKYAIVVDSVDEIVASTASRFSEVPSIERADSNRLVSEDVAGCIWVEARGIDSDPVMVLDVDCLVDRCAVPTGVYSDNSM